MEKAKQDAMSHGGKLHRLFVKDDKGVSNHIGDLLDDGRGPNPTTIPSSLICENAFEKNFDLLEKLDRFNLYCYSKAKDFNDFLRFMDYLKERKKAAKITLDTKGTVGYLFPGSPLADKNPKFTCYYKGSGEVGSKRPASQDLSAQSHSRSSTAAPAASSAVYRPPRRTAVSQPLREDAPDYEPSENIAPLRVPLILNPPPLMDGCVYVPPKGIPPWSASDANGHNGWQPVPASLHAPKSPEAASAMDMAEPPLMKFQPSSPPTSPPRPLSEQSQAPMIYKPRSPEAPPNYYASKSPEPPATYTPRSPEGPAPGGRPNFPPPPVKSSWGDDQNEAANFYGGLVRTRQSRTESLLYHMRELNNWVKSVLIRYVSPVEVGCAYIEILDLACGKGGDFHKWLKLKDRARIGRYVGSDIAKGSLDEAIQRFESNVALKKGFGAALMLVCADLTSESLTESDLQVWEARTRQWEDRPPLYPSDTFDGKSSNIWRYFLNHVTFRGIEMHIISMLFLSLIWLYLPSYLTQSCFLLPPVDHRNFSGEYAVCITLHVSDGGEGTSFFPYGGNAPEDGR